LSIGIILSVANNVEAQESPVQPAVATSQQEEKEK
jgi:hypothetical protein